MRCRSCQPLPEAAPRAAALRGRRWALAILWAAAEAGAVRFNEFKQTLEGIPPRTLAARLNELEEAGVLERRVIDSRPPRGEDRLTEAGRRGRHGGRALSAYAAAPQDRASAAISRSRASRSRAAVSIWRTRSRVRPISRPIVSSDI